ncbi:MAG: hypothetical protein COB37_10590 [Kordiimonadales bacterium]|nr:MAG: hypothetical protein COB37_10590 [Kordiimonadales bacterium]
MAANKDSALKAPSLATGMMFGGVATLIWGAWPVVTALGIEANLTPYQLVILRIFIAGPLLLPWAFRGKHSVSEWGKIAVLTVTAGAPYTYIVSNGFQFTSATHGGVIIPGTIMLTTLVASHFFLNDRMHRYRFIGACGIVIGLFLLAAGAETAEGAPSSLIGDLLFFAGGILWAAYTMLLRVWPMDPVVVTARVGLMSMVWVAVLYPFTDGVDFSDIPSGMLAFQALWQGTISAVIAIVLFNKGVAIMGASRATVLNAIIPVVSTILAFVVLSEVPTGTEQLGLLAILFGIATAMFLRPKPRRVPDTTTQGN